MDRAGAGGRLLRLPHEPHVQAAGQAAVGNEVHAGDGAWAAHLRRTADGLAGVALIFAGLVRSVSWLVALAAAGLVVLMLGAIVFHLQRREYPNIGLNVFLLALSAFIAYGRWVLEPF